MIILSSTHYYSIFTKQLLVPMYMDTGQVFFWTNNPWLVHGQVQSDHRYVKSPLTGAL